MLELLYTSTKTVTLLSTFHLVYLRSWDALLLFSSGKLYKVFRDGTQINLGAAIAGTSISMGNRVEGRHIWGTLPPDPTVICAADEITGQPHYIDVLNPTWNPGANFRAGDYLDEAAGLLLHSKSAGVIEIFRLADGVKLGEIADLGGPYYDNLAYAGQGKIAAFHHATGQLALVDYINRTVVFRSTVAPCVRSAYDCRHDLAITIQSDQKVRVYLMAALPAQLSVPAFNPVPAQVNRLAGYAVRTRLTGDMGEPCAGYLVNWGLAAPAKGFLEKAGSLTDADGYAENFYFGQSLGEETIQVGVTI